MAGPGREEGRGTVRGTEAASEAGNREGYSRIVGRVEGGQWEGPPCWAASRWLCSSAGRDDLGKRKRGSRQVRRCYTSSGTETLRVK